VASAQSGRVYLWNGSAKTLEPVAANWWQIPLDLRNPSVLLQALIYYRTHEFRRQGGGRMPDPNLPPSLPDVAQSALPIRWDYQILENGNPRVTVVTEAVADRYLGFDERGTWLQSLSDGTIYTWDFRTLTLIRIASRLGNVPQAALSRLNNAPPGLAAK
jgi:hypothetical protein